MTHDSFSGDSPSVKTSPQAVEIAPKTAPISPSSVSSRKKTGLFGAHLPGLDAVRGLSILLVMLYHFGMGWPYWNTMTQKMIGHAFGVGWCGVDFFFILSGLLISKILMESRDVSDRWRTFFMRRALRIFPAYYFVLTISLILSLIGIMIVPKDAWFWLYGYISNMYVAELPLQLSVTWSLAVEEQFYLIWPFVIWATPQKHIVKLLITLIMLTQIVKIMVYFLILPLAPHIHLTYLMPCRIDQFALGTLIATFIFENKQNSTKWLLYKKIGYLLGIPASLFLLIQQIIVKQADNFWFEIFSGPAFGLMAVALCMSVIDGKFKAFAQSYLFQFLGKYSYGLYLIHGLFSPLFGITPEKQDLSWRRHTLDFFLYSSLSIATALLLYQWIEKPALHLKNKYGNKKSTT